MRTNADFVRLLGAIRDHLAVVEPAGEIASVDVVINWVDGEVVSVQLGEEKLAGLASALLDWAHGLSEPRVTVWRVPDGECVHLVVAGRLVEETVKIYGGVPFEPTTFGDLQPGGRQGVSLGVLRGWALGVAA
ncbi:MAG TPA: hypothetical protein VFV67_15425 [Actinophytocola sp.]|uniref:hypothetical protein n=1 Tax=Actinophytocola sp. TaxID=1872138 RepID=UPI002DBDE307|nr:hypothetical protein [Actinophytocola sp.]HEU5472042.1 hypothetical protein [Actinophytocola sp.]